MIEFLEYARIRNMKGPGDKPPLSPKDVVAAGKSARILDGRLPDNFYQAGGIRLDVVALKIIGQFNAEIESLDQSDVINFENFYEDIARREYFRTLEEYAARLGLTQELAEILSENHNLFKRAHEIFLKIQNQESVSPAGVEEIIKGYKNFLTKVKSLFENFRDTIPEIL